MADTPETFEACVARVMKAGKIGRKDALGLLSKVDERAETMRATGQKDPYLSAAAELATQETETARLDRLDALRNASTRAEIMAKVPAISQAEQVILDRVRGSNSGSRENAQALWLGDTARTLGAIDVKLKKGGVKEAMATNAMDRDINRAAWARHSGEEAKVPAPAKAAAEAIGPPLDQIRDRQNELGARIGDAPDYSFHTDHDRNLMRRGGRGGSGRISVEDAFAEWWKWTEPKLAEKTFAGITPKEGENDAAARTRFGKSVFDALLTGIHMRPEGAAGIPMDDHGDFVPPNYEGTFNIAKKVSHPRVLFWDGPDAWYDYQQKYGRYLTLYDKVQASIRQGERNIALMKFFGTNPQGNVNTIIRRLEEKFRSQDPDGVRQFTQRVPRIQAEMAQLDGSAAIPEHEMRASFMQGAREYYDSISLGGVGVTHAASVFATMPAEMRHHGIGAATDAMGVGNIPGGAANLGRVLGIILKGKGPLEKQEILADVGAYSSGFAYNLAKNWNLIFAKGNTPIGRVSAVHNLFMNTTGMTYIWDAAGYGMKEMAAHNLGRQLDREYGALHPLLQNMLGKYGIGQPEWQQLRALQGTLPTWENRAYLTPSDALRTPGAHDLADKLTMYYQDSADHARVVPGVRERAFLYGKSRPGSVAYEFNHLWTQFKVWPVAAANQNLGREIHMSLSKGGIAWSIGLALAMSAMAGYGRMTVNDVLRGNPIRNPLSPATMIAGLAQGGGMGLWGDLAFGEVNRLGSGGAAALGGPMLGDGDALFRIYGRWRENMRLGRPSDFWPDIARLAVGHIPFGNLVYLKGSLDYLLWYHLFEAMKPGWYERTNRRIAIESGRTMQGYTPGGGVPYGIPGLYLKNAAGQSFGLLGQNP